MFVKGVKMTNIQRENGRIKRIDNRQKGGREKIQKHIENRNKNKRIK